MDYLLPLHCLRKHPSNSVKAWHHIAEDELLYSSANISTFTIINAFALFSMGVFFIPTHRNRFHHLLSVSPRLLVFLPLLIHLVLPTAG